MSESLLFAPYKLGRIMLSNRIVMAPMTRSRAIGNVPGELQATYYAQRAEAGLIVTEGTSPSPDGLGYARIPGLFDGAQVRGWRKTTEAVHREGSRIFVQLMHTGRVGHPGNLPAGARVVGPSSIEWDSKMFVDGQGMLPVPPAHAMTEAEIESTIDAYARSAELAMDAGFDGVELHGANGYLIEQFLNTASNQRTDGWGGSVAGRARFAATVARRVAERIGSDRVGIRVSPYGAFNGTKSDDDGVEDLHVSLAKTFSEIGLVYVHVVDHSSMGAPTVSAGIKQKIREAFAGTLVLSGGYDRDRAEADLVAKRGDLVAFGRPFISTPRLVSALQARRPFVAPDMATFYTPGPKGYTDYPVEG